MNLQLAYLGLTLFTLLMILYIGIKTINKTFLDPLQNKKKKILFISLLLFWQTYIFGVATTGILQNYNFPPRFVIFFILPAFIFTGIFIYKNRNNQWIQNIPKQWLIYYQTFRLAVETLLALSVTAGILHSNVTIHGYNYDMIFAFTAPFIAFLVFQKKVFNQKIVLLWNYLGLAVIASIIFLFITTIYFPEFYGSETNLLSTDFGKYPYILVAGFLMPSAVFMHILSIVQLNKGLESK